MNTPTPLRVEPWMRGVLLLSGFYNFGWGFFIYVFPDAFYQWITMSADPAVPIIKWQGLGVFSFGLLYILVAVYPLQLWYFLVLSFFSKLLGALWFYVFVMDSQMNRKFLFHLLMNDLLWLIPLGIILWRIMAVRKTKREQHI